jgi:hypothetical protein
MSMPEQVRVRHREGQTLTVGDLTTEQDHLIATRRRHDVTGHGPGIVRGLGLSADDVGFTLEPGMAVDAVGRALVLPTPLRATWAELDVGGAAALDLALSHDEESTTDRVLEGVALKITRLADPDSAAPPAGESVYLGRLAATSGGRYEPVDSAVTYPLAVAEKIAAQTGTSLLLGVEPVLAVRVPGGTPLAVSRSGDTTVDGPLAAADVGLERPLRFAEPVAEPGKAAPWRWYRADLRADGVVTGHALRVEVGAPSDSDVASWFRFVVEGDPDAEDPPLAVDAGAATTVGGDLTVAGPLVYAPLSDDPDDTRLEGKLLEKWVEGISAASAAIDEHFTGSGLVVDGTLTLSLTFTDAPVTNGTFHWALQVHNETDDLVTSLTVVTVTVTKSRATQNKPAVPERLAAGERTAALDQAVPLAKGDDFVRVTANAFGVLPGGRIAYGSGLLNWPPPPKPTP